MLIGYARVSTDEQNHVAQVGELQKAGCERIEQEIASGARWDRPRLQAILAEIGPGDVLVVWKLDRLGRSVVDIIRIMEVLKKRDARFRSITEAIDTTTAAGEMIMHVLAAMAQFERAMIVERTRAGLAKGRKGGRRFKFSPLKQRAIFEQLTVGGKSAHEIADIEGVHPRTIRRILQRGQERVA